MPFPRVLGAASALAVPILCVGADLAVRGPRIPRDGFATYAGGALLSLLVWGLSMEAARHPRRAVRAAAMIFIGVTAAFGIGLQAVVQTFTGAYLGRRALLLALGIPDLTHSSYLAQAAPRIALACIVPGSLAVGLSLARGRWLGLLRRRSTAMASGAAAVVAATSLAPFTVQGFQFQCLPPDILWINGTGGPLLYALGLQERPKALPPGAHRVLPPVSPVAPDAPVTTGSPVGAPSIVLILGESVRRDDVCGARTPGCSLSPRVDGAAPHRIGYARAFSVATCTELASVALWTGLGVTTPTDRLARAPLVWDWAKARGYRTAYFTSQNLLFQQTDRFLRGSRIDELREARSRALDAPIDDGTPDETTDAEALAFLDAGGPPAFVVVHHANTHAPYRQAPGFASHRADDGRGRYLDSLARDDALVGDLVGNLRRSRRGRDAIVLYTSDHGEAFGEHGASYHSFDLYAEQLDVPLWIDAPAGTLPEGLRSRLLDEAPSRSVSLSDVTATLLDLMGTLDVPAYQEALSALAGTSLLRPAPAQRDVLLWNCPPTRECATEAFGVVSFPLKLHYIGHAQRYACHDLAADPHELTPLPSARCALLFPVLARVFGVRPGAPAYHMGD